MDLQLVEVRVSLNLKYNFHTHFWPVSQNCIWRLYVQFVLHSYICPFYNLPRLVTCCGVGHLCCLAASIASCAALNAPVGAAAAAAAAAVALAGVLAWNEGQKYPIIPDVQIFSKVI